MRGRSRRGASATWQRRIADRRLHRRRRNLDTIPFPAWSRRRDRFVVGSEEASRRVESEGRVRRGRVLPPAESPAFARSSPAFERRDRKDRSNNSGSKTRSGHQANARRPKDPRSPLIPSIPPCSFRFWFVPVLVPSASPFLRSSISSAAHVPDNSQSRTPIPYPACSLPSRLAIIRWIAAVPMRRRSCVSSLQCESDRHHESA